MRGNRGMPALLVGVALLVALVQSAGAAEKPWLVYLKANDPTASPSSVQTLRAELIRQSALLAAREEFGALTRDANCSEPLPANTDEYAGVVQVEAVLQMVNPATISIQITAIGPGNKRQTTSDTHSFADLTSVSKSYERMIERYEGFSRSEAVALLKGAGLPVRKPAPAAAQAVPAAVEQRLGEMCYFAQFDALRHLHPALLAQPASAALLSDVSRVYANLGQLTRCNFDPSSRVYSARALLYAQRLAQQHKSDPFALATRGYAEAMAGMHATALRDLQPAPQQTVAPPSWASAAAMLCRYQRRELLALARKDAAMAETATYMAFMTVEFEDSDALVIGTAQDGLKQSPHCFRLLDGACAKAGVAALHSFTEQGMPMMIEAIRAEWPKLEAEMPKPVRDARTAAHDNPDVAASVASVARALVNCTAPSEPSWSMLGDLIEQTNFLHVFRRADFMAYMWSVPTSGFLAETKVLYEQHPMKGYLLSMQDQYRENPQQRAQYLATVMPRQWSLPLQLVAQRYVGPTPDGAQQAQMMAIVCGVGLDRLAYDSDMQLAALQHSDIPQNIMLMQHDAPLLNEVSPYDPTAASILVMHQWDVAQQRVEEWKKQLTDSPMFLGALASHYIAGKQFAEATKLLEESVAVAPNAAAYQKLADCYTTAKQPDKAVAALEQSLRLEDLGLDHARSQLKLAALYRTLGDSDKAIRCADEAAGTWAAWAMSDAAFFHEEAGHWEKANTWLQRVAERYNEYYPWYSFCQRTGQGNRIAASKGMERQCMTIMQNPTRDGLCLVTCYFWLEKKDQLATQILQQMAANLKDPWAAMLLAVSRDKTLTKEQRITALRQTLTPPPPPDPQMTSPSQTMPDRPYLRDLANLMCESLSSQTPLDPAEVQAIAAEVPPEELPNIQYPAAMFMIQNGRQKDGLAMLKQCGNAKYPTNVKITYLLALQELRDRKLVPMKMTVATTAPTTQPATRRSLLAK